MLAVGVMSGTSADGIEAAAIELSEGRPRPAVRLLAHRHRDFAVELRDAVLAAASGERTTAREVARLHAALGDAYAAAATELIALLPVRCDVIALHGQTVAHFPERRTTLQLGDASRVALATGVTTVADFRSADMAAGGQGAPLVPFADHLLFADGSPRAILNLGGIANLTLLPTREAEDVIAFDTGPGNMVSDAVARRAGERFDPGGAGAARGRVVPEALAAALRHPFFPRRAPKSTGREDFGEAFADAIVAEVAARGGALDDALATAVALTARTVADALRAETPPGVAWRELVVAGGGAANAALMGALRDAVAPLPVRPLDQLGIPAAAREAVAFAILGWYRLRGEPNTLPRCTGARRAVSAGAVHLP